MERFTLTRQHLKKLNGTLAMCRVFLKTFGEELAEFRRPLVRLFELGGRLIGDLENGLWEGMHRYSCRWSIKEFSS